MGKDQESGSGKRREAPREPLPGIDLSAFFSGGMAEEAPDMRRTGLIFGAMLLSLVLGVAYFFHVLLAFKTAIAAQTTAVFGPYPNFAIAFVTVPLFCGLFYMLLDYFHAKTGISPLRDPRGIGASVVIFLVLLLFSHLPSMLIRHLQNEFATANGYVRCSNQFDPQHLHIYALQNYVAGYGCPTVTQPQE